MRDEIVVCGFCGQNTIIQLTDERAEELDALSEEERDKELKIEAYMHCKCDGAQSFARAEKKVRRAEARCEGISSVLEVCEILKSSIRPLYEEVFDKLTIKEGTDTYMTYVDSNSKIHVRKETKVVSDTEV